MKTTQLGRSGLEVSRIGVGAWAMGGPSGDFNWGPQEDDSSIAAIERAVERGVDWIDTAAIYGFGHSEEVVGRALPRLRPRPRVFTKCERVWDDQRRVSGSLKAASIRREVDASLHRLQVDVIDLYQIHWPQPDEDIEEGWSTMCDLRREGKVRHVGVSNFDVAQLRRAQSIGPVDSLQPPYSLLRRGIEDEVLPYCHDEGIGVIVYSPMASGLLSGRMTRERLASLPEGDWRRRARQFQEPALSHALDVVEVLREIGDAHGRSPGEVAIAWTLRHPAVSAAIVGVRSPEQVDGVVGAADLELTDEEAERLEAVSERRVGARTGA